MHAFVVVVVVDVSFCVMQVEVLICCILFHSYMKVMIVDT